jgi:hypothetical protein
MTEEAVAVAPQELIPEDKFRLAVEMKNAGHNDIEIGSRLMQEGLDHETAGLILKNLPVTEEMKQRKTDANNDMLYGIIGLIAGVAITAFTYSTAKPGQSYVVASGAIIFGIHRLVRGLSAPR